MALQFPHISKPVSLGNVLIDAYQRSEANRRQREQDMAEKLQMAYGMRRQDQGDRQAALAKASQLMQAGDIAGAQAIMAPYGAQQEQYEAPAGKDWAPKLNQGEIDFADTLPMDRPGAPAGPVMPGSSAESDAAEEGMLRGQLAPNPIQAAAQHQAKQNKLMAMRLKGRFDDGTEWSLDPQAGRRQQQEAADQAFYQASGDGSPMADIIREQYPGMRAASVAGGKPLDADDIMKGFAGEARMRYGEAAADRRYQEGLDREDRKRGEWDRQDQINFEQAKELAKISARTRGVVTPGQKEDNERADVSAFRAAAEGWEKAANVDKLADAYDTFRGMYDNVQNYKNKKDTVGIKGALYGAARYITGPGVLTAQEYGNTVSNTAGWSAALETKVKNGLWGEISEGEFKALERFVENANKTIKSRGEQAIRGFDARFGPKSRYAKTAADDVAGYRSELRNRFGLGAERAAMTPDDQAAVEWARANRGDQRAAAILEANGEN